MSAYQALRRRDTSAESVVRFARDEAQLLAPESRWTNVTVYRNTAQVYFRKGKYDYRVSVERLPGLPTDPIGHAWGES